MGAIVLDVSKVNSYVLPAINKTSNTMQEAYSTSVSLRNSLPSSFNYRSKINEIVSQIYNIKREISNIDGMIESKLESAKRIEAKSESRASSISAAASKIGVVAATGIGATLGAATGGAVGAAVGAVVGNAASKTSIGQTIIDTGAKIVGGFVSGVKKIGSAIVGFFKDTGAKIADGIKSIWSKFSGSIKNIGKAVVDVTKKIGKAVYNTGAKIVNGVVSGVKKVGSAVVDGFKYVGSKVVEGAKAAGSWIAEKASAAWSWIKDTGSKLWEGAKKVSEKVWAATKSVIASAVNVIASIGKGVLQFGEALVDGVVMLAGAVASIPTAIYDGYQAIKGAITGEEWHSATKAMWTKGIMPVVSYEAVNTQFDKFYSNTALGQWLDNNAIEWCKSDGIICEIGSGVGYVAGICLLTAATAGTGTIAVSATTASTALAAVAGTGKAASKNFNAIKGEDGTFDNVTGGQIAKAALGSYASGAIEGAAWYFTYGNGGKVLEKGAEKLAGKKFFGALLGSKTKAKMALQFTKTILNDGFVSSFATGKDANWGTVLKDATIAAAVSGIYDKIAGGSVVGDKAKSAASAYRERVLKKIEDVVDDGGFTPGTVAKTSNDSAMEEMIAAIENGIKKVAGKGVKEGYTSVIDSIVSLFTPNANAT